MRNRFLLSGTALALIALAVLAAIALASGSSPSFSFSSDESGITYTCQLDNGTASACSSPKTYSGLAPGAHTETIVGSFTVPAPPPPSSLLVGDSSIEPTVDSNGSAAQAWQYTAATSGSATSISAYVNAGTSPVSLGLYTDASGKPGSLLDSATVSVPKTGWNTATLSKGVTISAGTKYWLAWVGNDSFRDRLTGTCTWALSGATSLTSTFSTYQTGTGWCPASLHVDGSGSSSTSTSTTTSSTTTTTPTTTTTTPTTTTTTTTAPPPTGSFSIQGTKILAPDGSTFLPVGANLDGQDIWWNLATTGTVQDAQAWGWNTVRLNSCLPGGCSATVDGCGSSCDYLPAPALDQEISEYTAQHIVVIPELHDLTSGGTASMTAIINWWTALATKYKDNPYVWFNPINEPFGAADPPTYSAYSSLYDPIVSAIRNTGAQNIIVLDGAASGQDSLDWSCSNSNYQTYSYNVNAAPAMEAKYGNILPSVHVYNQWGGGGSDHPAGSCTQQSLEAAFVGYMNAVHAKNVPLIVGETGDPDQCDGVNVDAMPGQCQGMLVAEDCAAKYGVGLLWWHGDLGYPPTKNGDFTNINSQTNPTNLTTANVTSPAPWDQGWGGGKALWDLGHGAYSPSRCTS